MHLSGTVDTEVTMTDITCTPTVPENDGPEVNITVYRTNTPLFAFDGTQFYACEGDKIWYGNILVRPIWGKADICIVIQGFDTDEVTHIMDYETLLPIRCSFPEAHSQKDRRIQLQYIANVFHQEFGSVAEVIDQLDGFWKSRTGAIIVLEGDNAVFDYEIKLPIRKKAITKIPAGVRVYRTEIVGIVQCMNGQLAAINQNSEIRMGELLIPVEVIEPEQPIYPYGKREGLSQQATAEVTRADGQNANFARAYGDPEHGEFTAENPEPSDLEYDDPLNLAAPAKRTPEEKRDQFAKAYGAKTN
jgi:hypothetical protein